MRHRSDNQSGRQKENIETVYQRGIFFIRRQTTLVRVRTKTGIVVMVVNTYSEACPVTPSGLAATKTASVANNDTATPGVVNLTVENPEQTESSSDAATGYIPGVGMTNPGQSRVWTSAVKKTISRLSPVLNCCLLGVVIFLVVTVLGLKLSFSQLEEKTDAKLSGIELSVSQLNSEHLKLESSVENLQGNSDGLFAASKPFKKWRDDFKCGPGFLTEDDYPAECNPDSRRHCDCRGCIDYRKCQ